MKLALMIGGALVAVVILVLVVALLVGARLPERHSATVTRDVAAPLQEVAALVRNVSDQSRWRTSVTRIEITERTDSALRYIEHGSDGAIPFVFREDIAGREFRSTIDTDALPFGGQWTIALDGIEGSRTRVRIREDGIVRSALFRFVSAYVIGHTKTIEAYLDDLEAAVNRSREPSETRSDARP